MISEFIAKVLAAGEVTPPAPARQSPRVPEVEKHKVAQRPLAASRPTDQAELERMRQAPRTIEATVHDALHPIKASPNAFQILSRVKQLAASGLSRI